jgi:hypothetical protein
MNSVKARRSDGSWQRVAEMSVAATASAACLILFPRRLSIFGHTSISKVLEENSS